MNISLRHATLCSLFALGGTVGGWALIEKLAGTHAASSFLQIGIGVVVAISAAQILLFFQGRRRLIYRVLFNIAFVCGIVWFMLCLLLPMLWVASARGVAQIALWLFLIMICIDNTRKAQRQFQDKWEVEAQRVLASYHNVDKGTMDWPKVLTAMRLNVTLNVPGVPESMVPLISLVMVLSMLAGLSLRNIFPVFSLFAWGVPACLIISIFVQLIGLGIAQVMKLIELEKRYERCISPKD